MHMVTHGITLESRYKVTHWMCFDCVFKATGYHCWGQQHEDQHRLWLQSWVGWDWCSRDSWMLLMLAWVGYWHKHKVLVLRIPYRSFTSLNWFLGSPNLVFCNYFYLILGVFVMYWCKNCKTLYMLLILVHKNPLLHFSSVCSGLSKFSSLEKLWLVAHFTNLLSLLIIYNKVFYIPYLYLH